MEKTIFITGAAQGIGKHLAKVFYKKGYQVVVADILSDKLIELTQEWDPTKYLIQVFEVQKAENWAFALKSSLEKFRKIDVLLNVAGVIKPGFVSDFKEADVDFHIDINLKGVIYGTKCMGQHMQENRQGHIINFASLAGVAPIHGLALYSASKYAVRGFTLAIVTEMKAKGVSVSVVCPDLVKTGMLTTQLGYEAAALTFSGNKILAVEDIESAILKNALQNKEIEILIPWGRGFTAKLGNFFPKLSLWLTDILTKKGLANQAKLKKINS
jgi:3-oxoacyl-[acyl-carrier protein] reductase